MFIVSTDQVFGEAIKLFFFKILRDLDLNEAVPRCNWFSRIEPKPMYESTHVQAFWDVQVYAEHTVVCGNGVYLNERIFVAKHLFNSRSLWGNNIIHFPEAVLFTVDDCVLLKNLIVTLLNLN